MTYSCALHGSPPLPLADAQVRVPSGWGGVAQPYVAPLPSLYLDRHHRRERAASFLTPESCRILSFPTLLPLPLYP